MSFTRLSGGRLTKALGNGVRDESVKFGHNKCCVELQGVAMELEDDDTIMYTPSIPLKINSTIDIVIHPVLLQYKTVRFPSRLEPGEEKYIALQVDKEALELDLPWIFRIYVPDNGGRFPS